MKEKKHYICGYCGFEFDQEVRKINIVNKQHISDQVKCVKCNNFLKTW